MVDKKDKEPYPEVLKMLSDLSEKYNEPEIGRFFNVTKQAVHRWKIEGRLGIDNYRKLVRVHADKVRGMPLATSVPDSVLTEAVFKVIKLCTNFHTWGPHEQSLGFSVVYGQLWDRRQDFEDSGKDFEDIISESEQTKLKMLLDTIGDHSKVKTKT